MKHLAQKICIWLISAILFIATLECAVRIEDWLKWNADFLSNYSSDNLRCSDQYGVHSRFNSSFEKWQINKFGFRGPDIEMAKPDGVQRVICMGASETFGLYEQVDMEYAAQLRSMLYTKKPGRFQVINAASLGTSIPKATQHYGLWLSKFNPDLVLYYPSPAFYLDESPPEPAKLTSGSKAQNNRSQFRIKRKLEIVIKKQLPETVQLYMKLFIIAREVRKHNDGWVWNSPPSDRLELFRSDLISFVESVRKSGAKPVLMTHAHRFRDNALDSDWYQLIGWRKFYPRASEKCLIEMENAANRIIREIGQIYHLPVIDLDKTVPKGAEYFADFSHFTDAGARVVADEMADVIMRYLLTSEF